MSGPEDPHAWVEKADEDMLAIERVLVGTPVPWSIICYHAQQAAEKILKACLVAKRQDPPRSHDLPLLLGLCRKHGALLEGLDSDCELLLGFGAATRYPGERMVPTERDGHDAIAAAKRVRARVLEFLRKTSAP